MKEMVNAVFIAEVLGIQKLIILFLSAKVEKVSQVIFKPSVINAIWKKETEVIFKKNKEHDSQSLTTKPIPRYGFDEDA